jgi:hypothetical protein
MVPQVLTVDPEVDPTADRVTPVAALQDRSLPVAPPP